MGKPLQALVAAACLAVIGYVLWQISLEYNHEIFSDNVRKQPSIADKEERCAEVRYGRMLFDRGDLPGEGYMPGMPLKSVKAVVYAEARICDVQKTRNAPSSDYTYRIKHGIR